MQNVVLENLVLESLGLEKKNIYIYRSRKPSFTKEVRNNHSLFTCVRPQGISSEERTNEGS